MTNQNNISISEAYSVAYEKLIKHEVPHKDAKIVAEHLIEAERKGYASHGMRRLVSISKEAAHSSQSENNIIEVNEPGFMLFDGQHRLGIAAVHDCIQHASEKANKAGAVVFGLKGYAGNTGLIGNHGTQAANCGFISVLMCNSTAAVAPHGSNKAILGTNPICVGMPTKEFPFIADFATSAWSTGAIEEAADKDLSIPAGVIQTANGEPTTNPSEIFSGSQLPMAGHKGYALGLSIELLAGAFLGAKVGRDAAPGWNGFLGIVIKVDAARRLDGFQNDVEALFREIKNSSSQPDQGPRIPGERTNIAARKSNYLSISSQTLAAVRSL